MPLLKKYDRPIDAAVDVLAQLGHDAAGDSAPVTADEFAGGMDGLGYQLNTAASRALLDRMVELGFAVRAETAGVALWVPA